MQSGYKGSPMRDEGMQMDNYDMSTGKYESTVAARPSEESAQINRIREKINTIDESNIPSKEKREMIIQLEKQIKQLEMRGGKTTFKPTTSSSKGGFRGGMDKEDELLKLKREFVEKSKNASPAERLKLKEQFRKLEEEIRMRGGSVYSSVRNRASKAADAAYSAVTSRPVGGRKPSARGAIVKKVMKEKGLTLPQASKYVKENGLY
jgi:hypothetical protein